MPIPVLIAGGGALITGLIGLGAHSNAKETNAKAESIIYNARIKYYESVKEFDESKNNCTARLLDLGKTKKKVLDTSFKDFIEIYGSIKRIDIQKKDSSDCVFNIDDADVVQLHQISSNFTENVSSGVKGAAAGALISLAATGSLPVIVSGVGLAGSIAAVGEIGTALELLGSTMAFGVAMTPFAALAAPMVFFSGISASIKADENLEKANKTKSEVDLAVAKTRVSQDLCVAIGKKASMLNSLLEEINIIFEQKVEDLNLRLTTINEDKSKICSSKLTEEDIECIAVTRALAGAVKAIIDVPILIDEGIISKEPDYVCNDVTKLVGDLTGQAINVKGVYGSNGNRMDLLIQGLPVTIVEMSNGKEYSPNENEYDFNDIIKRIKKDYTGDEIYDVSVYIKKDEKRIYYVINGSDSGNISIPRAKNKK